MFFGQLAYWMCFDRQVEDTQDDGCNVQGRGESSKTIKVLNKVSLIE